MSVFVVSLCGVAAVATVTNPSEFISFSFYSYKLQYGARPCPICFSCLSKSSTVTSPSPPPPRMPMPTSLGFDTGGRGGACCDATLAGFPASNNGGSPLGFTLGCASDVAPTGKEPTGFFCATMLLLHILCHC